MPITRPIISHALSQEDLGSLANGDVRFEGMTVGMVRGVIEVQDAMAGYRTLWQQAMTRALALGLAPTSANRLWNDSEAEWTREHPGAYDLRRPEEAERFAAELKERARHCYDGIMKGDW